MTIFETLNECSWCGKPFKDYEWCKALFRGVDSETTDIQYIEKNEGKEIFFKLSVLEECISGYAVPLNSAEKKKGWDIGFVCCDMNCVDALNAALNDEKNFLISKKSRN